MSRVGEEAERNRGGGSLKRPVLSNTRVNPPPVFDQTKFLPWEKDVLFW